LLEISGSHSNIISDSYVFHYGNELVSRTGNKEIRHFVTTNCDQRYPFALGPSQKNTGSKWRVLVNSEQCFFENLGEFALASPVQILMTHIPQSAVIYALELIAATCMAESMSSTSRCLLSWASTVGCVSWRRSGRSTRQAGSTRRTSADHDVYHYQL